MSRLNVAFVVLLLTGAVAIWIAVAPMGAADGASIARISALAVDSAGAALTLGGHLVDTLRLGQERTPAIIVGLGAVIVVPVIALVMSAGRRVRHVAELRASDAVRNRQAREAARLPRTANAWINVDGPRPIRMRMAGELLRIGRDEENDLRLADPNVHRHHALIQRTPDAEFVVLDVSGGRGNGVFVNGRPKARARLRDGDTITLGSTQVTFRCEPIALTIPA
ncbi:MAG: FHA domain-containing protein [Hyphomicrobiaceae bacterium]